MLEAEGGWGKYPKQGTRAREREIRVRALFLNSARLAAACHGRHIHTTIKGNTGTRQ